MIPLEWQHQIGLKLAELRVSQSGLCGGAMQSTPSLAATGWVDGRARCKLTVTAAGRGTDTLGEAQAAAGFILQRGVQAVLVKRGTSGSLLARQDGQCTVQPIFKATKVCLGYTYPTGDPGDCRPEHMHRSAAQQCFIV